MLPNIPRKICWTCAGECLSSATLKRISCRSRTRPLGGHYHLYVGQEEGTGVPAGSCLRSDDYLFTTHRNHGHLLARGVEPKKLFAEILGARRGPQQRKRRLVPFRRAVAGVFSIVPALLPASSRGPPARPTRRKRRKTDESPSACSATDHWRKAPRPKRSISPRSTNCPVLFLCENNGKSVRRRPRRGCGAVLPVDGRVSFDRFAQGVQSSSATNTTGDWKFRSGPRDDFRSGGKNPPRRRSAICRGANRCGGPVQRPTGPPVQGIDRHFGSRGT